MNKKVYSGYPGFKISLVSLFSAVLTIFFFLGMCFRFGFLSHLSGTTFKQIMGETT